MTEPSAKEAVSLAAIGRVAVIADDDEFFRMAMSALLVRNLGFERVVETGSLDEALATLADLPETTLALFDLCMPGMNGAASIGAVRECFPRVKTAILSASIDRRDVLTALSAGGHGYVPKTFGATEVVRAIDAILAGTIFVPAFLADVGTPDLSASAEQRSADTDVALTRRQREVLELIVAGRSNKEIALILDLGEGTVKVHVAALLRGLGVSNRAAAAAAGARVLRSGLSHSA